MALSCPELAWKLSLVRLSLTAQALLNKLFVEHFQVVEGLEGLEAQSLWLQGILATQDQRRILLLVRVVTMKMGWEFVPRELSKWVKALVQPAGEQVVALLLVPELKRKVALAAK